LACNSQVGPYKKMVSEYLKTTLRRLKILGKVSSDPYNIVGYAYRTHTHHCFLISPKPYLDRTLNAMT